MSYIWLRFLKKKVGIHTPNEVGVQLWSRRFVEGITTSVSDLFLGVVRRIIASPKHVWVCLLIRWQ